MEWLGGRNLHMNNSGESSSSADAPDAATVESPSLPALPLYVLEDIINRLEDARDVARAQRLCRDWRDAGKNVRSLRIICLDLYHERARNDASYQGKSFKWYEAGASTPGSTPQEWKGFKEVMEEILRSKVSIVQLRIEVEAKLQSKSVLDNERRRTDFWLSDSYSLKKWLRPPLGNTLQHLCIVDYGQQAIMRRSKIVKILSETCHGLKTLDLRNLFIDTSDCNPMPAMTSLTLRCVKVVVDTLQHINDIMFNLQTLALLGVFGAERGHLEFQKLKVLCLGLSTPAKDVVMICSMLEKLQLKMQCPEKLIIEAKNLKYVAFNLDVMQDSKVELRSLVGLKELLYGASSFVTLSSLVEKNHKNLGKIFLDVPCMALAEDGRFLGVLKDIPLQLPSFSRLHQCDNLEVLNIGPGLWYSMEIQVPQLSQKGKWPSMKSLILHMIPHNMEAAIKVLEMLLRPSVMSLVVFVHESSPMTQELMSPRIREIVDRCEQNINLDIQSWKKTLDFSCFSF